ncbi:MAG TPA: phage tail protein I [Allosphingosinicella sp.]|uniref:phage tail protein I n=1 Tax=Allosphingosinicella sp. TaxID=2823234 RepID=UPI002ED8448B
MTRLLPPNATSLERAIEDSTARLADLPVPLRRLWDPVTCPEELLPYLAWALSIDTWSSSWPIGIRRARVAAAIAIQRRKGTASSVREVIESFGGSVALREWWQQDPPGDPHTFSLVLNFGNGEAVPAEYVDQVIQEVARTKPARAHFTFTQGLQASGRIGLIGAARAMAFLRLQAAAPAEQAALKLDFRNGEYLLQDVAAPLAQLPGYLYSRSGAKAELGATSGLVPFAPNVPGIVPGRGYLARGSLTNAQHFSQDFASWATKTGLTVVSNGLLAPDGTATADTLVEDNANGSKVVFHSATKTFTAGDVTTTWLIAKAGTGSFIQLTTSGALSTAIWANFDLANGVVGTASNATSLITPIGDGWFLCAITYTAPGSAGTVPMVVALTNASNAGRAPAYLGAGKTVHVWQGQHLTGTQVGPAIATGGAAATIGADVLDIGCALADEDFAFWAVARLNRAAGTLERIVSLGDGSAANRLTLDRNAAGLLRANMSLAGTFYDFTLGQTQAAAGRVAVMVRRRGGKYRAFSKNSAGAVVASAESAALALPANGKLSVGHLEGIQQTFGAIELFELQRGSFEDAACLSIMGAL